MAEKATKDAVAADLRPPNYPAAINIISKVIPAKKDKIAGVNGEIADCWAKVEGFKVNKIAGRMFGMVDKLDFKDKMDVFRDFNKLCETAGWQDSASDLVDKAENNVVPMRAPGSTASSDPAEDTEADLEGLEKEIADAKGLPAVAAKVDKRNTALAGVAAAPTPPVASKPTPDEPYTGDNSDLAAG